MPDILSQIKPKIASIVSEDSFKTWIEPLSFIDLQNDELPRLALPGNSRGRKVHPADIFGELDFVGYGIHD